MTGGGGGSGGAKVSSGTAYSYPGAPSGFCEAFIPVSPSTGYSYVIGNGGINGTGSPAGAGQTGGTTYLSVNSVQYESTGGGGGTYSTTATSTYPTTNLAGNLAGTGENCNVNFMPPYNSQNGGSDYSGSISIIWGLDNIYTMFNQPPSYFANSGYGYGAMPVYGGSTGTAGLTGGSGAMLIQEYS